MIAPVYQGKPHEMCMACGEPLDSAHYFDRQRLCTACWEDYSANEWHRTLEGYAAYHRKVRTVVWAGAICAIVFFGFALMLIYGGNG